MKKNIIILTMGEPSGVGPEVLLNSFKEIGNSFQLVAISDFNKIKKLARKLAVNIRRINTIDEAKFDTNELNVLHLNYPAPFTPGLAEHKNTSSVIKSIDLATRLCLEKEASAMVTGPINKSILKESRNFRFNGHTDYLEHLCNLKAGTALMMMANPKLRIVLVTIHEPLNKVSRLLTSDRLEKTLINTIEELKKKFDFENPKVGVLGLNPHAGENGLLGKEEILIIKPTIRDLIKKYGYYIDGPFSADSYFGNLIYKNYDVTLAMYHDQALIPLKLISFFSSVNITIGLPIVRTSPGHGTAMELAKKGGVNSESFTKAIITAAKLAGAKPIQSGRIGNE